MQLPSALGQSPSLPSPSVSQQRLYIVTFPADLSIVNTTVLQNIAQPNGGASFSFPIGPNEEWFCVLLLDTGAVISTTGIKLAVVAPVGALLNLGALLIGTNQRTWLRTTVSGTALDSTAALMSATTDAQGEVQLWVKNGSVAGVVQFQFSQSTSSGTAITVRAGSYMRAERVS